MRRPAINLRRGLCHSQNQVAMRCLLLLSRVTSPRQGFHRICCELAAAIKLSLERKRTLNSAYTRLCNRELIVTHACMSTYQTRETAVAVPYAFIEYMSLAMSSPEAERIRAELFPSRSIPPLRISEIRAHEEIDARTHHVQTGVKATRCTLAGLRAEWMHTLGPEPVATFLYLHGGGFVGGCRAEHRLVAARLAAEANSRVLLPQYRLAPEHPYPAALEDARAVYYELLCQGVDPRKLLLIGDSAGGGLCAALLLALRDAGSEMPV